MIKNKKSFCTNCGKELLADSKFCQFCGEKVEQIEQEESEEIVEEQKETPIEVEKIEKPKRTRRKASNTLEEKTSEIEENTENKTPESIVKEPVEIIINEEKAPTEESYQAPSNSEKYDKIYLSCHRCCCNLCNMSSCLRLFLSILFEKFSN